MQLGALVEAGRRFRMRQRWGGRPPGVGGGGLASMEVRTKTHPSVFVSPFGSLPLPPPLFSTMGPSTHRTAVLWSLCLSLIRKHTGMLP